MANPAASRKPKTDDRQKYPLSAISLRLVGVH